MAKNNDQDLHRLREILYGEESKRVEDRLSSVEHKIITVDKEIKAVDNALTKEIGDLQVGTSDDTEQLQQQVVDLKNAIATSIAAMKHEQQAMLADIAKIVGEIRQSNAHSSKQMIDLLRERQATTDRQIEQLIQAMMKGSTSYDSSKVLFKEDTADTVHLNGDKLPPS